jgi:hypothetical protein
MSPAAQYKFSPTGAEGGMILGPWAAALAGGQQSARVTIAAVNRKDRAAKSDCCIVLTHSMAAAGNIG